MPARADGSGRRVAGRSRRNVRRRTGQGAHVEHVTRRRHRHAGAPAVEPSPLAAAAVAGVSKSRGCAAWSPRSLGVPDAVAADLGDDDRRSSLRRQDRPRRPRVDRGAQCRARRAARPAGRDRSGAARPVDRETLALLRGMLEAEHGTSVACKFEQWNVDSGQRQHVRRAGVPGRVARGQGAARRHEPDRAARPERPPGRRCDREPPDRARRWPGGVGGEAAPRDRAARPRAGQADRELVDGAARVDEAGGERSVAVRRRVPARPRR